MFYFVILFFYPILYLLAFFIFGGMYSSRMQEINRTIRLLKTRKFKTENLTRKIRIQENRIKKIQRAAVLVFFLLLIVHLGINWMTIEDSFIYKYAPISCVTSFILLIGVYLLRGHGTIDDNPRLPGGMRI